MHDQNGNGIGLGDRRPGHPYVLAKDNESDYKGPDWCPFNLWQSAVYAGHGHSTNSAALKLIDAPGAKELWAAIGGQFEHPDNIAVSLPNWCAEIQAHWRATPKMAPSEFKADRRELSRMAGRLAHELHHFFDRWDELEAGPVPDAEDGGAINFTQLLTEAEQIELSRRATYYGMSGFDAHEFLIGDDRGNPGVVPNLPSMMTRIGALFEDEARFPPLERPNGPNAERNYFCRRLISFFRSAGGVSPAIVASVVSIFFPQGISENEVSQQIGRLPSGRRPAASAPGAD